MNKLRGFALRRAVLGTLLAAGRPMTVAEILGALAEHDCTVVDHLVKPPNGIVANLLDYQESIGRVERTARATYRIRPWPMSKSTRWRYEHWWR